MSRYFCVQSSSMMSASRPIIVSAPRMTFPAFTFSPPQLSEKFSTASIIKSTTAPTAWKIGPKWNHKQHLLSLIRVKQFAGHLVEQESDRTAFPRFLPRSSRSRASACTSSAVTPNAFATLNKIVVARRRVLRSNCGNMENNAATNVRNLSLVRMPR